MTVKQKWWSSFLLVSNCLLLVLQYSNCQKYFVTGGLWQTVHAFVTARFDYYNSIPVGIPDAAVGCLVSKTGRYEHITHWLPVRYKMKATILTYKALRELAPPCIRNTLQICHPSRTLRSTRWNLLLIPRVWLKTFGRRPYHYAALTLWNQLPDNCHSINSFKSILKTYLFSFA